MEKILDDIVKRINGRLKEMGMTQKEFSEKLGKNPNWLTALKHVQHDIKLNDLLGMCSILNVEPSYLLGENFSSHICNMNLLDIVKMLVKQECDFYLDKKLENIKELLQHIRKDYEK